MFIRCLLFNIAALPDPGIPLLDDTFQVDVQANLLDKGRTVSATVYFDDSNNRAAVKYFEYGHDGMYVFNYMQDEVYNVTGKRMILQVA